MIDVMDWNKCERDFIRNAEIDKERINSIVNKSLKRLKRARETKVNLDNVSFVVEDYYEVIKELLVAYLLKNGLKSKNHQCLISYFYKENPEYENETNLILRMAFFRNRSTYYGDDVPMEFYEKNKKEFEHIIELLKGLVKK